MASASNDSGEVFEDDSDDEDFIGNKQNGSAIRTTDRFGFLGGEQYTDPDFEVRIPPEILRKRELKWLDMLENWEKWMSKRFKKVKDRCRKGIPPSLRARAWQFLCGSKYLLEHNKGKYDSFFLQDADPKWEDEIRKDLHRQFPLHEMFTARGGYGQEDLFHVLRAYTMYNPQEGYCQAQAPVAAVLLMHMPAEEAFWCLVSICEKYLPGYYSLGLEAVQVDGEVLFGLLKKVAPASYKHIKKQTIDPVLYMMEWFMCVYSRTLPWSTVLRVWDMFFCEGVKVMFRVALLLFKLVLGSPDKLAECPSLYETIEKLKHIPYDLLREEDIVRESLRLTVNEHDMEREHRRQLERRKREKEKRLDPNRKRRKDKKEEKKQHSKDSSV